MSRSSLPRSFDSEDSELRKIQSLENQWHQRFKIIGRTTKKEWVFLEKVYCRYRAASATRCISPQPSCSRPFFTLTDRVIECVTAEDYLFHHISINKGNQNE